MSNKKRSSKNLKINTSIALTSVLSIVIPLIIIGILSALFFTNIPFYSELRSSGDVFGVVNETQWSQVFGEVSQELNRNDTDAGHTKKIKEIVSPLEEVGSLIYIEKNGVAVYATDNADVLRMANSIIETDKTKNINYFGSDGLVIVNQLQDTMPDSRIIVSNSSYTVDEANEQSLNADTLRELVIGRTGLVIFFIVLIFIIAIAVISSITAKIILVPIRKLATGADEIAKGNLDYNIDYDSTNELGQTVGSFNGMRLRLKASLEKQSKAEEERRVLVAGIAHDLRTPLTSAKGYAEGILDGIADTPEKKEQYIRTICQSINETEKILDDLLAVSKLELKDYELNLVDVKAKEFFDDGAAEIKNTLENENFDFSYNCKCGDNTVVSLDTDRFVRVINNIISNSIKYAKSGVKGKVEMSLSEYERSVILEISDNGIGVDRENLHKIFDIMYRADPARTSVKNGSGLGLSICKQIVEMHGGAIWAGGRPGEGLSIFISMPSNEQNE